MDDQSERMCTCIVYQNSHVREEKLFTSRTDWVRCVIKRKNTVIVEHDDVTQGMFI